jgi:predicted XRE-type DNA-binding protein
MAHKFAELEAKMSKESIARSDALFRKKLVEMIFSDIRRSRGMSQKMLAAALHIKQPNVAKLEKRTDIYISTLRAAIEAMGGTLDITARFPDYTVKITNFSSIGKEKKQEAKE